MDDAIGDTNTADIFSEKYEALYNSVFYDKADIDELLLNIHSVTDIECVSRHLLSCDDVSSAPSHVRRGKSDGYGILYSDHFINSPKRLCAFLAMLFNSMLTHGFSPDGFNVSTM